jgi:hypothetical protein
MLNKNLEQQAQAIFKSWFIEDPEASNWISGTFSDIIETMIVGDWGKDSPVGNNTEMVYCIRGADIPEVKAGNKGKMPTIPTNISLTVMSLLRYPVEAQRNLLVVLLLFQSLYLTVTIKVWFALTSARLLSLRQDTACLSTTTGNISMIRTSSSHTRMELQASRILIFPDS